ncbi:hypothetical protein LKO27_02270 [Tessaracoccus sp. OS52]|uniref:hypothetical protein n=1 Tax=Tessaracoccus sp. OS52 TaxID=2886691 RepID=UPI001D10CDA3|nr:hypothetical protein [Tessaracoccus sp. OS52]MCC2592248.1 hypothetical protein [Tessaracoccus sp. OS52]
MGNRQPGMDPKSDALAALDRARVAREGAEAAERDAVASARAAGASWSRIGELYGLTKQGAQQRFKPAVKAETEPGLR